MIDAQWFGGYPAAGNTPANPWERIRTPQELARWVEAWGEGADNSPFENALLSDPRIGFWQLRRDGLIVAGGISFASGPVVGLSNWFAKGEETAFALGLTTVIAKAFPERPVVLWSEHIEPDLGLRPLGGLRVWISS